MKNNATPNRSKPHGGRMSKTFLLLACLILPTLLCAQKESKVSLNIVFIGNSITYGAQLKAPLVESPPVQTVEWLRKQAGIVAVDFSNQGVGGSTTVDFLPASRTFLPKVKQAADAFVQQSKNTLLFSLMLGTNDSASKGPNGSPVSAPQYFTNVKVIADELLSRYPQCLIVLHRPIWYSPNTHNGATYLKEGLNRLESYLPQLQTLVGDYALSHPNRVFMGDMDAFDYFKENYLTDFDPEEGHAGTFYLHPNQKGAAQLGQFWGKAIDKVIQKR